MRGRPTDLGTGVDVLGSIKRNVKGNGVFTMRHTANVYEPEDVNAKYTLGLTLSAFQCVDVTDNASPSLNNRASGIVFEDEIGQGLNTLFSRLGSTEGASVDQDDDELVTTVKGRNGVQTVFTPPGAVKDIFSNAGNVPPAGSWARGVNMDLAK